MYRNKIGPCLWPQHLETAQCHLCRWPALDWSSTPESRSLWLQAWVRHCLHQSYFHIDHRSQVILEYDVPSEDFTLLVSITPQLVSGGLTLLLGLDQGSLAPRFKLAPMNRFVGIRIKVAYLMRRV